MLKLFYKNLESKYTEILNDYLKMGYEVNTQTFSGHQGEICKIDLKHHLEPNNVIRILFDKQHNYETCDDIYRIFVIKYYNTNKRGTLWNEKPDEILQQNLYYEYQSISNRNKIYLISIIDYNELTKIRNNRRLASGKYQSVRVDIDSKIGQFIFKYCKKQSGYKSIKKIDISWIERTKKGYRVYFKGKNTISIR